MRSYSSRKLLYFSYLVIILLLSSCGFRQEANERVFIPKMELGQHQRLLPPGDSSGNLEYLYEPAKEGSACEWLGSLPTAVMANERFRLLGNWGIQTDAESLLSVEGEVDIGASPLYQFALLSQAIPDKQEFLALLDQEYEKAVLFGDVFKLGIARFLLSVGILDPYSLRNSVIEERMEAAFPGAFPEVKNKIIFPESIPGIVFKNGNPLLPKLSIAETDSTQQQKEKQKLLLEVFSHYKRPLRLFSQNDWASFATDMQLGLAFAIHGFSTNSVREQGCSTVILHRAFAQMLTIMGYTKLPVVENAARSNSHLPRFEEILTKPTDQNLLVCPTAGSFVKNGFRMMLSRDDLASNNDAPFELSAEPYFSPACDRAATKPNGDVMGQSLPVGRAGEQAKGSELLAFLNGVVNFSTAFNPGASWWRNPENQVGFPLSPFESLERIKNSGSILPSDAHALALGLVSLGFSTLQGQHLVFVDHEGKLLTSTAGAAGVRISEESINEAKTNTVITTVRSAAYLMEIAFKLSSSLNATADWKQYAENSLQDDLRSQPDRRKQREILKDYNDFIETTFAGKENLEKLVSLAPVSLRSQLQDLKLAASVLGMMFANRDKGGNYRCYSTLVTDLTNGSEKKLGDCSTDELRIWKYSMKLAAQVFRSPLFAEAAK